jgi:hypothetical protein
MEKSCHSAWGSQQELVDRLHWFLLDNFASNLDKNAFGGIWRSVNFVVCCSMQEKSHQNEENVYQNEVLF